MTASPIPTLALTAGMAMGLSMTTSACVLVGIEEPHAKSGGGDVTLCHKGKKTMTLPSSAAQAHMDHGDRRGPC